MNSHTIFSVICTNVNPITQFPITPLPSERNNPCTRHSSVPVATAPQPAQPEQTARENIEPYRVKASDPDAREKIAAITGVTDFSQLQMVHDPRINGYWVASRAEWDKLHQESEAKKKAAPKASKASTASKAPTTPTTPATPTTPGLTGLTANQKKKAQKKASAAKKKAAAQEAAEKETASTANPAEPTKPAQLSTKPAAKPAEKPAEKPAKSAEAEDEPKTTFLDLCPPEGPFAEVLKPDPRMWRSFPTQAEVEVQDNKLMAILARIKSEVPDVLTHEQSLARIAIHNGIDVVNTGSNMPEYDASNDPARMEEPTPEERELSTKKYEALYKEVKMEFMLGDGDWEREEKKEWIMAAKRPGIEFPCSRVC
jgi:hypothetical protein